MCKKTNFYVGFSGSAGYASVTASDDVDASMDGYVYYESGVNRALYGGFSQRTYGEVRASKNGDKVKWASCEFYVVSEDGSYSYYGFAD